VQLVPTVVQKLTRFLPTFCVAWTSAVAELLVVTELKH